MFDARAAKALKPGEHLTVDEAPGLRLVATMLHRTWIYRYRSPVDAAVRQVKLGRWPAMGLPAALATWQVQRAARDAGADPAADRRASRQEAAAEERSTRYTVRVVAAEYLKHYRGSVVAKTFAEAERLLGRELDDIADVAAEEVTRSQAFDLLSAMQADRPRVAAMLRQHLGAAWDRAIDSGRMSNDTPNWWRLVLRGKLPSKGKAVAGKRHLGKRVLSDDEVATLLPWLPNFSRDVEDALTLYLWTCCRGSEIVAMERGEIAVEPDGLWWTIPREKLKMRRNPMTTNLRVPLAGRAAAVVRRRLDAAAGAWLFPSAGVIGHVGQKALGVAVWSHMPYAGTRPDWVRPRLAVTHWAPHDLRRTGRTMLAALGCPSQIAEAILGHMLPGVEAVYNRHGYDSERRLWLTRLAEHLESLSCRGPAGGR